MFSLSFYGQLRFPRKCISKCTWTLRVPSCCIGCYMVTALWKQTLQHTRFVVFGGNYPYFFISSPQCMFHLKNISSCCLFFILDNHRWVWSESRGTRIFQSAGGHLKILDWWRMTLGKFLLHYPQILCATLQNIVARDLWNSGLCHEICVDDVILNHMNSSTSAATVLCVSLSDVTWSSSWGASSAPVNI